MTEDRGQTTDNKDENLLSSVICRLSSDLRAAGIDNPALDTRVLIAHALQLDRAQLLSQSDRTLTKEEMASISVLIDRRARREPVSRILGTREFWGLSFGLNEATLVPRPESETLIEAALEFVADSNQNIRILDLGTGTGCLLLALLHELPNATGLGIDIAPRAAEQARENAERLGFTERAEFRVNDWADNIDESFDIVLSNPPYIVRHEIAALMPEVRDHDPRPALDGGEDGVEAYRLLIPQLPRLLKPNGVAVFEIGAGQAESVLALFFTAGFKSIQSLRDLSGIDRCIAASIS